MLEDLVGRHPPSKYTDEVAEGCIFVFGRPVPSTLPSTLDVNTTNSPLDRDALIVVTYRQRVLFIPVGIENRRRFFDPIRIFESEGEGRQSEWGRQ